MTLGWDSTCSLGDHGFELEQPKVFTNGDVIFGISGDLLIGNVIQHADLPAIATTDWDVDRFVTNELIPAIMEALSGRTGDKSRFGALIVVRGRVYEVFDDFSWTRRVDRVYATGSGWQYAIGALATGASVREALEIAAKHDTHTGHTLKVAQSTELLERNAA